MKYKRLRRFEILIQSIVRKKPFSLAIWSIVITIIICLMLTLIVFVSNVSHLSNLSDITKTGPLGDTFNGLLGPFIAFLVALLTFLAFYIQYQANEQQKGVIQNQQRKDEIEKLETKFFEMVKLHRDNVGELIYTTFKIIPAILEKKSETKEITSVARKVFKVIFSDFKKLNEEIDHFFTDKVAEDIYELKYLNELKNNDTIKDRKFNLINYAKIDILYCILYFGLSSDDRETIRKFFKNRYKGDFFEPIIFFASLKPKEESDYWPNWVKLNTKEIKEREEIIKYFKNKKNGLDDLSSIRRVMLKYPTFRELEWPEKYDKYYGGHQFRLGHYFRHLYQAVTFINKSKIIDYEQKYSNIKLLRGQLSTFEQSIIFLDSLSTLGRVWEFESRDKPEKKLDINYQLITKYNFIKNILNDEIIKGIKVSHFYPLVEFEAGMEEDRKIEKENLKKLYK